MNIKKAAAEAKKAKIRLTELSTEQKNKALTAIEKGLRLNINKIIAANQDDFTKAEK